MNMPTKALFAAVVLSFTVAAGAAPSHAGILDGLFGGGGVKVSGNINQTVNATQVRTSSKAKVNAAVIKGKVEARNIRQSVTLRNITANGSSQQNYAVLGK